LGPRSPPSIRVSVLRSARVRIPAAVLSWRCRVCRFGGQGGDRNGRAGVQGHLLLLHPRAAPREHAPRQRRCRCVLYSLPLMLHARSLCMLRCALPRLLARYGTRECFPLAISGGCISLSDRPFPLLILPIFAPEFAASDDLGAVSFSDCSRVPANRLRIRD
jgi:hypothetical protein